MYTQSGCPVSEIIERCGFSISKETIYNFLREQNVLLIRRTGRKHNLIGQKFGYLTVVRMAQTKKSGKHHEWRAICRCSNCGNKKFDVSPQSLLRKQTTSCGCRRDQYLKNTGKNSKQYTGYEGINGTYWGKMKNRAENRGYKIMVDIKYAGVFTLEKDVKDKEKIIFIQCPNIIFPYARRIISDLWNNDKAVRFRSFLKKRKAFPACCRCTELYRY